MLACAVAHKQFTREDLMKEWMFLASLTSVRQNKEKKRLSCNRFSSRQHRGKMNRTRKHKKKLT